MNYIEIIEDVNPSSSSLPTNTPVLTLPPMPTLPGAPTMSSPPTLPLPTVHTTTTSTQAIFNNTAMSAMGEVMLNATKPPVNIKVVGVGGGGGNAVTHMIRSGVKNVTYITVNTDSQALYKTQADIKIQLGDNGQGAGANPNIARRYAEAARAQLKEALKGADMVFITAGLGKGTGTGASAVVAQVAQELEALTVCVVTKPFTSEGPGRAKLADAAADELELHSDSIIVVLNSKLEAKNPDGLMREWYQAADDILKNAVATIVEVIQGNGYQNVDFRDVASVIASNRGRALMGTARASGPNRAKEAALAVVNCDLLEEENLRTARGVLINITASEDSMRGREATEVIDTIRASFADDVTPIYGMTFDDAMGDEIQVTLIVSGIGSRGKVSLASTLGDNARNTGIGFSSRADFGGSGINNVMGNVRSNRPAGNLRTGTDDVMFNPSIAIRTDAFQDPMLDGRTNHAAQNFSLNNLNAPNPAIPTLTQEIEVPTLHRVATYAPTLSGYSSVQPSAPSMVNTVAPVTVSAPAPVNLPPSAAASIGMVSDVASVLFNPSAMSNPKQEAREIVAALQDNVIAYNDIPTFLRNQIN